MDLRSVKTWVSWALFAVTILLLLSGFGIVYYGIVTPLTFGILGKAVSYRLHLLLWGPFLILLLLHIYLSAVPRKFR